MDGRNAAQIVQNFQCKATFFVEEIPSWPGSCFVALKKRVIKRCVCLPPFRL